jgi:hypothetical protein
VLLCNLWSTLLLQQLLLLYAEHNCTSPVRRVLRF